MDRLDRSARPLKGPTVNHSQQRDRSDREAWLARSRTTWNDRAADWNAMLDEQPEQRNAELDRAASALQLQPGMHLLDAGCGTGQWAVGFASRGCQVTAIDLAPEMLRRARANAEEAGVEIAFREGDLSTLPDPDATYDAIHCRCALQFSPAPVDVVLEFLRVIKPGGRVFVSVPGALSPIYAGSWRRFIEPTINNHMLPWELEALLTELGWEITDGWGAFMEAAGGEPLATPESAQSLPLRLRQAAATFWITIATPADR